MSNPDEQPARAQLDREHLPEKFSADFLRALRPRDLVWLERDAVLTQRQRDTFLAASQQVGKVAFKHIVNTPATQRIVHNTAKSAFREFAAVPGKFGFIDKITGSKDFSNRFQFPKVLPAPRRDPLADDIQQTLRELTTTPPIHIPTDLAGKRHREQQEILSQVNDHLAVTERLLYQLAQQAEKQQRQTELQRREREQQKTTNLLLACIATASMIAAFAAVQGTRMWWSLIITWIAIGVLYVVLHRGGPPDDHGHDGPDAPTERGV